MAFSVTEAEEPGRTVAKTHGSSSSPLIVPAASSLYISILLSRSPRLASQSSRRSISSCKASVDPAVRMNLCFRSSRAHRQPLLKMANTPVGLSRGFFTRHLATKSLKSRE